MTRPVSLDFDKSRLVLLLRDSATDSPGFLAKCVSKSSKSSKAESSAVDRSNDEFVVPIGSIQELVKAMPSVQSPAEQTSIAAKTELYKRFTAAREKWSAFLSGGLEDDRRQFPIAMTSSIQAYFDEKQYVAALELISSLATSKLYPSRKLMREIYTCVLNSKDDLIHETSVRILYELMRLHGPSMIADLWQKELDRDLIQNHTHSNSRSFGNKSSVPNGLFQFIKFIQHDLAVLSQGQKLAILRLLIDCIEIDFLICYENAKNCILYREVSEFGLHDSLQQVFEMAFVSQPKSLHDFQSREHFQQLFQLIVYLGYEDSFDLMEITKYVCESFDLSETTFNESIGLSIFKALAYNFDLLRNRHYLRRNKSSSDRKDLDSDYLSFGKVQSFEEILKAKNIDMRSIEISDELDDEIESIMMIVSEWSSLLSA